MPHPEVEITDIQGSMPPELSTGHVEVEIDNPRVSSASQLDLQFDLAGPGFDNLVWDTIMNDFSFLMPQNGPSL
jgi:hypothetical protein